MPVRRVVWLVFFVCFSPSLFAQDTDSSAVHPELPNIFIDCDFCDRNYALRELDFVNHVRDQEDADIYILVTSQFTGSGGRSYRMVFHGRNEFAGIDHTLEHTSRPDETDDERRAGRIQLIKMGLMPYLALAGRMTQFDITYEPEQRGRVGLGQDDSWNNWVFNVFVSGGFDVEESQDQYEFEGGVRVRRITEVFKLTADLNVSLDQDNFESGGESIRSRSSRSNAGLGLVKSIDAHWSYGAFTNFSATTFRNTKGQFSFFPAIEYNFYPWEESDRRLITISYYTGVRRVVYNEETIFGKTAETIFSHSLNLQMEYEQPWGEIFVRLEGAHLLNDLSKNRVELFSSLDVRIARGLSVFMRGSAELIHDQLFLPAGDASLEEVLLRRRQLKTDFEFSASLGLRLTFGSTYNNVVNQRL